MSNTKILIHQEPWDYMYQMAIVMDGPSGKSVADQISITKLEHGQRITPCASFDRDAAQNLFDELWRLGFRPQDGTGNSGHIEAIKYHLEDMRKLVFDEQKNAGSV